MKANRNTMTFWAVVLFLLCYFTQLLNFPNVLTVMLGAALCLLMVIQQKCIRVDAGLLLLALAMVSYYVIVNGIRGLAFTILYIPLIISVLTNYTVCSLKDDGKREEKFFVLILVFVLGYAVHGILNAYMFFAGYVIPGTRQWQDYWTGAIVPGTQHTAYFLPVLAMFLPSVLYLKKRKWLNTLLIFATVFFGYTSLATKSRMSILIFAIVLCVQLLLFVIDEWNQAKKLISDRKFWGLCGIVFIAAIVGLYLMKDSEIVTAFMDNMGKGGGILNNVRFEAQRLALKQLFDYPMGGRLMDLGRSYCHNTWLDMANAGGLIPFFSLTGYSIYGFYKLFQALLKENITSEIKLILTGLFVVFFLYWSVEPALDASVHLITPWIFINSMILGRLNWN